MSDEVYLDKIRLGAIIVEKELRLINQYNNIIGDIRRGIISKKDIDIYPLYAWCWQNLAEIYDFLKNDYLTKITKSKEQEIKDIMKKFKDLESLSVDELTTAKEIILEIMSKSKFHDVVRKMDSSRGLDKIRKKYYLKDEEE